MELPERRETSDRSDSPSPLACRRMSHPAEASPSILLLVLDVVGSVLAGLAEVSLIITVSHEPPDEGCTAVAEAGGGDVRVAGGAEEGEPAGHVGHGAGEGCHRPVIEGPSWHLVRRGVPRSGLLPHSWWVPDTAIRRSGSLLRRRTTDVFTQGCLRVSQSKCPPCLGFAKTTREHRNGPP